ncbi:MAG: GNAT family N-acetyltransferase [Dehalococcoidales bacterium]|nr:GNAT family N-acetyltransferase [Dehalococcoidales bacterium]
MDCSVSTEDFDSVAALYKNTDLSLKWDPLFVLPVWLETWWNSFGGDYQPAVYSVKEGDQIIGIAPLKAKDGELSFIGSSDVCDYLDFVIVPGKEQTFYTTFLEYLEQNEAKQLVLESVRPDSTVANYLSETALLRGCEVSLTPNEVSLDVDLPSTWDEFLGLLNSKQRHETRRKLRRLEESGKVNYYSVGSPAEVNRVMDIFLKMFVESREDKADFLTGQRETFFRTMAANMSEAGIFRFGVFELDEKPVAIVMYFDFKNGIYLYNSGFEAEYLSLSVGLMSKVLCVKESVESGKKVFDFLKGNEVYKYRLGGKEIHLTDYRITLP